MNYSTDYPTNDLINFSKWSDCTSLEIPFKATTTSDQQQQQKIVDETDEKMLENEINCFGYTSLPTIFNETTTKSIEKCFKKNGSSSVSLFNHSETSGFAQVVPTSSSTSTLSASSSSSSSMNNLSFSKYEMQYKNHGTTTTVSKPAATTTTDDDENLLISDKTHFRPIKQTYADGYTFEIPSQLDEITYKRSDSGSMYLDSNKYAEYKIDDSTKSYDDENKFVLKFCIKQIEKYCQTDDSLMKNDENFFNSSFSLHRSVNDDYSNDYSDIEMDFNEIQRELKNCVCYEQKYDNLDSYDDVDNDLKKNCTVHPFNNKDIDNWSMKNKCLNNNNSHTSIWGHCTACKTNNVKIPANHKMKAELLADGDEIMSDLKFMQNLFIGTDWEDETCQTDEKFLKLNEKNEKLNENFDFHDCVSGGGDDEQFCNVSKLISDLLKPETATKLANVLGQSQGKTILQEIALSETKNLLKPPPGFSYNNNNNNNNYICGNHLSMNNNFNIWQHEPSTVADIWDLNGGNNEEISYDLNNKILMETKQAMNMDKTLKCNDEQKNKNNKRKRRHSDVGDDSAANKQLDDDEDGDDVLTVITCKYWATDSSFAGNPSSILKHVMVATRPLTR